MARTTKRQPSVTRKRSTSHFPIVLIVASAGGIDALKRFLTAMPGDSGMAFVVVPHLDPTHESSMVEILARYASMPVDAAAHKARLRPNHVYVIPPNRYLAVKRGALVLSKPTEPRGLQTAIDFSLCSLAKDRKGAAIGIVLSGTGSHGTLGAKEIKLAGGTVIAQDPATAEYDQMPRSALATGLVDFKLAPEQMPNVLMRIARQTSTPSAKPSESATDVLETVIGLLRARGQHDFRHYRPTMIIRRIERRMALKQIESWEAYVEHLRHDHDEVKAVCRDLLIGVTSFFRDPRAFDVLAKQVVPELVERAGPGAALRIWVPGCATGEEAYSLAILFLEQFKLVDKAPDFHIFATDVDDNSLERARHGVYPNTVAGSLSPEQLTRYFVKSGDHYQISKPLRDSIGFSSQNLINDAPFSKVDLISCRNLLIYLEPEIQSKVISLLHFSLTDDGYLMLGPSESLGNAADLFEPLAKRWRIYRRTGSTRGDLPTIPIVTSEERRRRLEHNEPPARSRVSFPELMRKLLVENFAPASVLINGKYEVHSSHGPLVDYLEFPPGEPTKDLLAMARQGLRAKIRAACERATREQRAVVDAGARVGRDGGYAPCSITVSPVRQPKELEPLLLVAFRDREASALAGSGEAPGAEETTVVGELENELRTTREDLQTTIERQQDSNEDLRASNEEVMSMNEELQSANEELETSKEELQSLNEELVTVNSQLHEKVDELADINSDLTNVMAATDIATVFLDTELRIKRFTPPIDELLHLLATDIGRPFRDLARKFEDADLLGDARRVIATFIPAEKEVRSDANRWYKRRIQPYHSSGDRVGGVVITFIDITERVSAEALARRLATVLFDSNDAVWVCDLNGRIAAWNRGAERIYGYSDAEARKMNLRDLVPEQLKGSALDLVQRAIRGETNAPRAAQRVTHEGHAVDVWLTATPLRDEMGEAVAIAITERKITEHWEVEEEIRNLNAVLEQRIANRTADLEASEQRIRAVLDSAVDAIVTIDASGRIETCNAATERTFGYSAQELIGRNVKLLMPTPHREHHDAHLSRYQETREPHVIGTTRELTAQRKDGTEFPIQLSVNEITPLGLYTGTIRDITDQKALHEEIVRIAMLEQRRIGQELHDGTQQELTGLSLLARSLSDALAAQGTTRESELAAKLAAGISETNWHVHSLARGLVPVPVDARGLMAALDDLARRVAERDGPRCRFDCPTPVEVDNDIVATHLFRIAQEAVTNAVKHARAREIRISLKNSDGQVQLSISDDGVGIEKRNPEGLGMRTMEHRRALIGGALTVHRKRKDRGTVVTCTVPMPSKTERRPAGTIALP